MDFMKFLQIQTRLTRTRTGVDDGTLGHPDGSLLRRVNVGVVGATEDDRHRALSGTTTRKPEALLGITGEG